MPRFKIETSLFEPVTIDVEGGRTYVSVPLSPFLIQEVSKLEEQRKAGTLDNMIALTQQVALIFGLEPKDVEITDIRILTQILTYATNAMMGEKAGKIADVLSTDEKLNVLIKTNVIPDIVAAEKNGPKPEGEVSQ